MHPRRLTVPMSKTFVAASLLLAHACCAPLRTCLSVAIPAGAAAHTSERLSQMPLIHLWRAAQVYQTGDLANMDGLQPELAAKLPTLLRIRNALYSQTIRSTVEQVRICGQYKLVLPFWEFFANKHLSCASINLRQRSDCAQLLTARVLRALYTMLATPCARLARIHSSIKVEALHMHNIAMHSMAGQSCAHADRGLAAGHADRQDRLQQQLLCAWRPSALP